MSFASFQQSLPRAASLCLCPPLWPLPQHAPQLGFCICATSSWPRFVAIAEIKLVAILATKRKKSNPEPANDASAKK